MACRAYQKREKAARALFGKGAVAIAPRKGDLRWLGLILAWLMATIGVRHSFVVPQKKIWRFSKIGL